MRLDEKVQMRAGEPVFKAGGVPMLVIAYLVGEFLTFGFVSDRIGFFPAFMLAILKSVLGFMVLGAFMRRMLGALARNGGGIFRLDGAGIGVRLVGAIFLVLPGFLSGVIAALLLLPGLRDVFGRDPAGRDADGVIELSSADWREVEDEKPARRKRLRKPGI